MLQSPNADCAALEGLIRSTSTTSSHMCSISDTDQVHISLAYESSHQDDGSWIEDPIQRQSIIIQACQKGSVEYLYPILECFDEHPHPQDFSFGEMLRIAVQAQNHSIIDFLKQLARRDGIEIDLYQRKPTIEEDFPVFNDVFSKAITKTENMETSEHGCQTRHPNFLCSAA